MNSMLLRLTILGVAVLAAGASSQYKVQRAALVPHQQPNQRSGQSMGDNRQEISLGTSTLSVLTDPKEAPGENAGLYIPRVHVSGAARFRLTRDFDMGVLYDQGLDKNSMPIQDGQPEVDNGDVYGGGLTLYYSVDTGNPDLRIGLGFDALFYSIPYVQYRDCITNCIPGVNDFTDIKRDRDTVPVIAFGITPSWRLTPELSAFGGVTMRNHPTVPRTEIEDIIGDEDPVEAGPMNFIANAGVEYAFSNGIRAMVHMFQPVYADPVRYGPTFGAAFTIPLGRDKKPAATQAMPVTAQR
jgi:hypothetical protein